MTCAVHVSWVVVGGLILSSVAACATAVEDGQPAEKGAAPAGTAADDPAAAGPADPSQKAADASGYTRTRYPIVLVHGMGGFDKLFGAVEYFYGIPEDLRAGGATVYVASLSAFASTEARGEQLLAQVEYFAALSGSKLNLIGHSQGGLDVRYVAAVRPDLVASVTTVATPHDGAEVADFLLEHTDEGGVTQTAIDLLGDAYGLVLDLLTGTDHPTDAMGAIEQISTAAMADFNQRYPHGLPLTHCSNGPEVEGGIRYYSWSGASALTNVLDPSDSPLAIASLFAGGDSDGLVERCGSHFGRVIRDDYRMNHLDEVNQVLGLVSLFETNPKSVFRAHANRLKNAGL